MVERFPVGIARGQHGQDRRRGQALRRAHPGRARRSDHPVDGDGVGDREGALALGSGGDPPDLAEWPSRTARHHRPACRAGGRRAHRKPQHAGASQRRRAVRARRPVDAAAGRPRRGHGARSHHAPHHRDAGHDRGAGRRADRPLHRDSGPDRPRHRSGRLSGRHEAVGIAAHRRGRRTAPRMPGAGREGRQPRRARRGDARHGTGRRGQPVHQRLVHDECRRDHRFAALPRTRGHGG